MSTRRWRSWLWPVWLASVLVVGSLWTVAAQEGATETWDSDFGPVTINYGSSLSGFWEQEATKKGRITGGSYDPSTHTLSFTYYQDWNDQTGRAVFSLSSDGMALSGTWTQQPDARSGTWEMQRPNPSVLLEPPCAAQEAAFNELRTRWGATRLSLETFRDLKSELDLAHEDLRQSVTVGAIVDLAAIPPGWPLSSGVADRLFDTVKDKAKNTLLKAGLKSVEVQLLKDPSLEGLLDHVTKQEVLGGLQSDVAWEGVKVGFSSAFGEVAGDTAFAMFDFWKLGRSMMEGRSQLDASLTVLAHVNDHINKLFRKDLEQTDVLDSAKSALELCQFATERGVKYEPDGFNWPKVVEHLGLEP